MSYHPANNLCKYALVREEKGNEVVYCTIAKGIDPPTDVGSFLVKKGEVCVATEFFSTKHKRLDSVVVTEKMEDCEFREAGTKSR